MSIDEGSGKGMGVSVSVLISRIGLSSSLVLLTGLGGSMLGSMSGIIVDWEVPHIFIRALGGC